MLLIILFILTILFFYFKRNKFTSVGKVAITSAMYKPKNVETWLEIHRKLGISHFYIRLEDTPELVPFLQSQPDVTLETGSSDASNQYTSIMDRQLKMANDALVLCKKDNIQFLIQIDCDEILEGDLQELFSLPDNVDTFWMQNYEAVYSGIPSQQDNCFSAVTFKDCGKKGSGCVSYVNGKGGCRVNDKTSSNGCHRFKGGKEVKLSKLIVKHFESCDFEQYVKKYQRYQKGAKLSDIPFPYYRESIESGNDVEKLKDIYIKYRTL